MDLISRQAAIDAVIEITYDQTALHHGWVDPYYVVNRLEYLPIAEKKGRWKISDLPTGQMKYCSECGFGQYIADVRTYHYCPNCGARMTEESDGNSD